MTKLEDIEKAVATLAPAELARFRTWFAEFDAAHFDHAIESGARQGRLDALAEAALAEHQLGRTRRV